MHEQLTVGYGLCECGCGELTNIARRSDAKYGHIKGLPVRFIVGHATRKSPNAYEERDCGYTTLCWVWLRSRDKLGYARMSMPGRSGALAHVVFWEREHGAVPAGTELDHLCRNSSCVNPDHLEPVTHAENVRRGRRAKLTPDDVRAIRVSSETERALATQYGVHHSAIGNIRRGKRWKGL
jgi:hypothetical protein